MRSINAAGKLGAALTARTEPRRSWTAAATLAVAAIAIAGTACAARSPIEASETGNAPGEPLPIRVVIPQNPIAGNPNAEVQLRAVAPGGTEAEVLYRTPMNVARSEALIDVALTDGFDILVDGTELVAVPRSFWEGMSRGRMIIRVQAGGIELVRSIEPNEGGKTCAGDATETTCWSTERWYFPNPLWDTAATATPGLKVRLLSRPEAGETLQVRLVDGDPAEPILSEMTFDASASARWAPIVELDVESTLVLVVGDRYVEIAPDIWHRIWKDATLTILDDGVLFESRWPASARNMGSYQEDLPFAELP